MANQSKNRVKLNRKYRNIGFISVDALKLIRKVYNKVPKDAKYIRVNGGNAVKHNIDHLRGIKTALDRLGLTNEGYAEYVARNYTEIYKGNVDESLLLVVRTDSTHHLAAVHLDYDKNENFWLVTSVHPVRDNDIKIDDFIWMK